MVELYLHSTKTIYGLVFNWAWGNFYLSPFIAIPSRGVTMDEVWFGNLIYRTPTLVTTNNYDRPSDLHTPTITV
jgi:hypothetical protein